ncbi:MAG: SDR family oxidoreductase [Caulobacteraceae bacterium]
MTRRLALVTGASAGIGAALARLYASHGYDVALIARRADRLEALAEDISLRYGVETLTIAADLSERDTPDEILARVTAEGRQVDALVNNAGYGVPGTYAAANWQTHQAFLNVMTVAPCELAHKVIGGMIERRFGRIINVASLAGLAPGTPGATLYAASKAFLVKFSQSLHLEVKDSGVHVSALCPGFTYSEFHDVTQTRAEVTADVPAWMWMGADEVAAAGYEAAEANRAICVTGAPNKAIAALAKLAPDEWLMALVSGRARRMRNI